MTARVWSVLELTRRIRELLETDIDRLWVQGEISGFKVHPSSGHAYFNLKEEGAVLACVAWAPVVRLISRLRAPKDGLRVRLFGRLTVYEQRGVYQLVVEQMLDLGEGELQAAFQRLKLMLEAEGLFSSERKRPLPLYPRRIGIVTSPGGAALQDMLRILGRRWPVAEVVVRPAAVQGEGAAEDLAAGLADLNELGGIDVILLGRGGGSLEDLWAFNEEVLARAIAASGVPVVSAVGHEVDFTISDFVADVRAATPSNAAEIATPDREEIARQLGRDARFLRSGLERRLEQSRLRLDRGRLARGLRRPEDLLRGGRLQADGLADRLQRVLAERVERGKTRAGLADRALSRIDLGSKLATFRHRAGSRWEELARRCQVHVLTSCGRVELAAASLSALGPERILARGYCILTRGADGRVVRRAGDVAAGDEVCALLHQGELMCQVTESRTRREEKEARS